MQRGEVSLGLPKRSVAGNAPVCLDPFLRHWCEDGLPGRSKREYSCGFLVCVVAVLQLRMQAGRVG